MYKRTSIRFMTLVSLLALCSQSAHAQGASYGSGGGLFSIPNFQGDRRSVDLYRYIHPTTPQEWNVYRMMVQQYADAVPPNAANWGVGTPGSSGQDAYLGTSATIVGSGGGAVPGLVNQGGSAVTATPALTTQTGVMSTAVPGLAQPGGSSLSGLPNVPASTSLVSSSPVNASGITANPPVALNNPALQGGQGATPIAMQNTASTSQSSNLQGSSSLPITQPATIGYGNSNNSLTGVQTPSNYDCGAGLSSDLNGSMPNSTLWSGH